MRAGGHYSLLANAIYTWQIYGATAIKSGRVIAWKAIMTVEAAGLRGSGRWCKTVNLVCLALRRVRAIKQPSLQSKILLQLERIHPFTCLSVELVSNWMKATFFWSLRCFLRAQRRTMSRVTLLSLQLKQGLVTSQGILTALQSNHD